jgi:hypothetical protein
MIIGNKDKFGFELSKVSDSDHTCKLKLFVDSKNICEWKDSNGKVHKEIWWNLDELINYLHDTVDFIYDDDPFPVDDIAGECASELDNNARDFESENDEEMEDYYDSLDDWTYNHSWYHARSGAVVPDVMFRKINNRIEVSWWNDQEDEGRFFTNKYGYALIDCDYYRETIEALFDSYNNVWK